LENLVETTDLDGSPRKLKVPQVGWNQIWQPKGSPSKGASESNSWSGTPLKDLTDGEFMYFVHSFYVKPAQDEFITSVTQYGQIEFCSSLQYNTTFACQFHPERSGINGLKIYENIAEMVKVNLE
jgi:glutamine amidotransferase